MNRSTRDKFTALTSKDPTAGNATWQTPPAIFRKLNDDFGPFEIDLTASATDHLCPVWFEDALAESWKDAAIGARRGYSNPPYGRLVPKLLRKAVEEARRGFSSTFLLPLRANATFREYVLGGASELWFCDKRIVFWENGAPRFRPDPTTGEMKTNGALFDSIIVRYLPGRVPGTMVRIGIWKVPEHVWG